MSFARLGTWVRSFLQSNDRDSTSVLPLHPAETESFGEDNNRFALAIYRRLAHTGNVICSPFSIRTVLAMAEAGARGETAAQLRHALCTSSSDAETARVALAWIIDRLNAAGAGKYTMSLA